MSRDILLHHHAFIEPPPRLAAYFAVLYALLIVVVSLYPFSGWRMSADTPGAFLFYSFPEYFTAFDLVINVAAYVPLGLALAAVGRAHGGVLSGLLLATVVGTLLSLSMEFTQQFLPTRVASNLDLLCNASGAVCGGCLVFVVRRLAWWWQWRKWRVVWIQGGALADFGMVLLGMWLCTQLDPAVPLFGVVMYPDDLPQPFDSPLANPELFLRGLEGGGAYLHLLGVAWLAGSLMRRARYGLHAALLCVVTAFSVKLLFAGLMLKSVFFFEWANANVAIGWLAGILTVVLLRNLRRIWQTLGAIVALAGGLLASELWPLQAGAGKLDSFKWGFGQLANFKGLVHIVSAVWPYLAIGYLLALFVQLSRRNPNILQ